MTDNGRYMARRIGLAIVGLSFLWPCLGSFATMHFRHAMVGSASLITGEWHAVTMGALYLVAIACCLVFRGPIAREFSGPTARRSVGALGLMGLLGHVFLVASPLLGESAPVVTGIVAGGFALSVAFIVGHVLAWGLSLAAMPLPCSLFTVVASNALSFAVQLAIDALTGGTLLVYLVICPVISAILWCAENRLRSNGDREAACEPLPLKAAVRGLPWKFIVPIVALIYFEQAFTSLLFERYANWPRDNLTVTLAVSCIIWLAASLWLVRGAAAQLSGRADPPLADAGLPHARRMADNVVIVLFAALLVVYMAALLATVLFPQGNSPVIERFLVAAGSSLRVLLWLALACTVTANRTDAIVAHLAYVLFILAIPVSRLASVVFSHMDDKLIETATSPRAVVTAAGVMLFIVAVAFVVGNAVAARRAIEEAAGVAGTAGTVGAAGAIGTTSAAGAAGAV